MSNKGVVHEKSWNQPDPELVHHDPSIKIIRSVVLNGLGPEPETKRGLIACYGRCDILFTWHEYAGRKTVSSAAGTPLYQELHYICVDCGCSRIWGTEIIFAPSLAVKRTS
jgi:hypothetical protein